MVLYLSLFIAVFILPFGKLADIYGRKTSIARSKTKFNKVNKVDTLLPD